MNLLDWNDAMKTNSSLDLSTIITTTIRTWWWRTFLWGGRVSYLRFLISLLIKWTSFVLEHCTICNNSRHDAFVQHYLFCFRWGLHFMDYGLVYCHYSNTGKLSSSCSCSCSCSSAKKIVLLILGTKKIFWIFWLTLFSWTLFSWQHFFHGIFTFFMATSKLF